MSRATWDKIKQSKGFFIRTYRWTSGALVVSLLVNVFFILCIYYKWFHQPDHTYYASSGWLPPEQLTPLDQPNTGATPLLPNEPPGDTTIKMTPN